jgi:hypothetical protein
VLAAEHARVDEDAERDDDEQAGCDCPQYVPGNVRSRYVVPEPACGVVCGFNVPERHADGVPVRESVPSARLNDDVASDEFAKRPRPKWDVVECPLLLFVVDLDECPKRIGQLGVVVEEAAVSSRTSVIG